ncbi:hypothetical protein TD95_002373 [Thielaviopsis punctulata]|uniref:Glycosyltransferase subfamily 4-like N-terminal domain-containing protein n=1 Tax=Thielaviopsis punctulata TaxID=72032 RepID=A0A0F4ZGG5_9PEZI|nr:hypothetical protein TD95_002373 [Thielaviopsis punctulata]
MNTLSSTEQTPLLGAGLETPLHDYNEFPHLLKGKRILLCTESFGPVNGVSRTTLMLVNHLRAQGANVAVVAPQTTQNTFTPLKGEADNQLEVRINGYPLPFNPELSIVYPVRISALIARTWGAEHKPDLIYLASPASLGFQIMLQVRQQPRAAQIPVICNFQTDLSGYCGILFPWPLSSMAMFTFDTVQSYLFRHDSVKTVFYPSRFVLRYLQRQGVQEEKMDVIRRGVNASLFRPSHRDEALRTRLAPNGEVILICISRLAGEKGFGFLADAAKELHRRSIPFVLYIVGGNRKPEVEQEIHKLFEPLQEVGRVVFAGFRMGDELAAAYASGDIFLHCSVTETFGLVVLEAMASGVPVVARDEGGPSDIITHGKDGYLVPPNDLSGFVHCVEHLITDKQHRQAMALACRETACNATWVKINNKVAWRMADVINQREAGCAFTPEREPLLFWDMLRHPIHALGLLFQRNGVRTGLGLRDAAANIAAHIRLGISLLVIFTFWAVTGVYLAFAEIVMWTRSWRPWIESAVCKAGSRGEA